MPLHQTRRCAPPAKRYQGGITTLAITLILLVILTVMALFSANVGFFEQRTTTNENRAQLTESLAEYALNLGGEYLKSSRVNIISKTGSGWLVTTGTGRGWVRCPSAAVAPHPCAAERDPTRRAAMYFFDNDRSTVPASASSLANIDPIPYSSIGGFKTGALTGVDTDATRFAGNIRVDALLCRIGYDLTNPAVPVPSCQANPTNSNNVAVTLISQASLTNESSSAVLKETWATSSQPMPAVAVPLIASGLVEGLGNAQIVASPNAGGYGVYGSIWSPNDVDIGNSSGSACGTGGLGSVSTCHIGEYLQGTPRDQLKTTCATSNNACGCPAVSASGVDFLSGHSQSVRREGLDILDADGSCGPLPDITFFPIQHGGVSPKDDDNDPTDDSLFEYTFNVDYVVDENGTTVNNNCPSSVVSGQTNCAAYTLTDEFGATVLTDCSSLNTSSSGIYYVTGDCDLPSVGSATSSVILVVDGDVRINGNVDFYGMFFARSNNNTADVRGNGNVKIFGAMVVEGNVDITGSIDIVYDTTAVTPDPNVLPASARFGKVTGSWLDNRVGI
jgi:hypothetical protein